MVEPIERQFADIHIYKERDVRDKVERIYITKIRDSEAGGLPSVKQEEYFHGFLPKEQVAEIRLNFLAYDLLIKVGDFLVRQAVKVETKSFAAEHFIITVRKKQHAVSETHNQKRRTDEEIEQEKKHRDENEIRHIPIKYSRRARLYYVRLFGFTRVSGLIEYHRRKCIPLDEDGTIIRKAIRRAEWQLNHEQITKTKKLGDGAFGDVYKGILRSGLMEWKEVAIKTIVGSISTEENEKLFREAMLMKRLVHPNVITLVGVASNEEPVMIVMEFAQGGSVLGAIQSKPGPSPYTRIKYCHGAALGLQYLSEKGIIHRDVAARNCLIGKNDVAKISDFGLSIVGTQKKEKALKKVPVRYLAPETLKQREYTVKTDVWSFGVFMWEVFHDGKQPYAEMSAKEVRRYVLDGKILDNESDHYPQHMWLITINCFARDPRYRPDFDLIAAQIWAKSDEFKENNNVLTRFKFW